MLPIDAVLPALLDALARRSEAVLSASPGAGKTTRVPLALLEAPWAARGRIVMLAPRRLAARAAAARMAHSLNEAVGETIGYRVRLDSKVSARTRIEVVTEGVFTRMILDDPALEGVACVIFDEFHERSLDGDLGLALARDAQQGLRPDLRLLVMSATLDAGRVAHLLGDAPAIIAEGRMFPVSVKYRPRDAAAPLEADIAALIRTAMQVEEGDALVFLPGAREIERPAAILRETQRGVDVHPLYAALGPDAQDGAIAPAAPGRRKIVLATSIAETSLTIEGVRIVVDSGLARRPRYEPGLGLARLETVRASQAAIEQRKGRAGRTAPGVCWRLWSEPETRALPAFDKPEIVDADLSSFACALSAWGVASPDALSWLDPPPREAWRQAVLGLERIGARDEAGRLTAHGARVAAMPMAPALAHMVIQCAEQGAGAVAARLAVLLGEQGLGGREVDLEERLRRWGREETQRARKARGLADRLARLAGGAGEALNAGICLAYAFPERVAKARGAAGQFLMANGRAASVDESDPLARAPFLVVADATGRADRTRILAAAAISADDVERLFAQHIETRTQVTLDANGAARARRVRRLGKITLSEGPLESVSDADFANALLAHVSEEGVGALPWSEGDKQLRARVALLRSLDGEGWPDWSDAALQDDLDAWLAPLLEGVRTLQSLGDGRLGRALEQSLPYDLRRALNEQAPTRFETPASGSALIDYVGEGAPSVDVRLQELFGMAEHPSVAKGRAPLLLRLLSPAHRPVQMTRDLPGFWRGSYAEVRADMRGRYPKHPWPDDPLSAPPTRRAKPKGSS